MGLMTGPFMAQFGYVGLCNLGCLVSPCSDAYPGPPTSWRCNAVFLRLIIGGVVLGTTFNSVPRSVCYPLPSTVRPGIHLHRRWPRTRRLRRGCSTETSGQYKTIDTNSVLQIFSLLKQKPWTICLRCIPMSVHCIMSWHAIADDSCIMSWHAIADDSCIMSWHAIADDSCIMPSHAIADDSCIMPSHATADDSCIMPSHATADDSCIMPSYAIADD